MLCIIILVGGHLSPSLFIGSALGALLHYLVVQYSVGIAATPSSSASVSLSVLLGGVSFLSASFTAPLTAVLLLLELTHSHPQRVLLPLLVSSLVAYFFTTI